jgi:PAS domain S-box-containing protein
LIGLVTLLEFLFHFSIGIDELFVKDKQDELLKTLYPGRMAYNSAVDFSLLGLGFIMLIPGKRRTDLIAQYLFHSVTVLSAIALIGYLYGVSLFKSILYVTSMATHTAILFFILSVAASLLNSSLGFTSLFTGKQIGNKMARRLFGLMLVMVVVFGAFRLQNQQFPLFSLDIWISLLAVCFLLISLVLIWDTANWLNKLDSRQAKAEAEIKNMNAELEERVEERTAEFQKSEEKYRSLIEQASDAIYVLDEHMNFTEVNDSMCKMIGYSRNELMQMTVPAIVDPDELVRDPLIATAATIKCSVVRERRFMRKDGSVFTVEINVKKFSDNRTLVIARDISDRKRIEDDLREAEMKFRTIAEKSIVGVYIVQKGKFTYVNPRFAEIFGYKTEELTNTVPVETIIHESHRHITTENVRRRIDGEVESVNYEVLGLKKDGTTNCVEFYGSGATMGGIPTIIGSMLDITERRKAENELKASEQKYKLLFESSPLPLWMIAKDNMTIIDVNEAAAKLYGYSRDELINMSVTKFRTAEDREIQLEGYQRAASDDSHDMGTVKHLKKDGTPIFVNIVANDIIFEGRAVRLSFTNDITERLKAKESLQKSEANLQTILKTTNIVFAMISQNMEIMAFNPKAADFVSLHYKRTLEKGQYLTDYLSPERAPKVMNYVSKVFGGKHISYELNYKGHWYNVSFSPVINDHHEILGMLLTMNDMTESKQAEQDLRTAYTRIQSQISSIKGMAWKQSHLMRSPLANLKALADLLKEHPADTESLTHFQAELDRLDTIIHEMAQDASDHVI